MSSTIAARSSRLSGWRPPASAVRIAALVRKDLLIEWRRREQVGAMALFSVLVLVVFTFALDLASEQAAAVAPGALWVAFLFAGTIGLGRAFASEREWGTLDGLLMAPAERAELYLAKVIVNAGFMFLVEAISLLVFGVFFNLPVLQPLVVVVCCVGTIGLSTVGTLFGAMVNSAHGQAVLLPVLLFPVLVPVVIGSVKATGGAIDGSGTSPWLGLLVAFDTIFLVVALWTAGAVLEE